MIRPGYAQHTPGSPGFPGFAAIDLGNRLTTKARRSPRRTKKKNPTETPSTQSYQLVARRRFAAAG